MGTVYKALHTKLEKVVALKVLPAERLQDTAAIQRFEREMKAVGQLEHPNIVRATDAGEIDATHYLVMELVDGIDLSVLVRRVGPAVVGRASSLPGEAATDQRQAGSLRHLFRERFIPRTLLKRKESAKAKALFHQLAEQGLSCFR